jgi:hypothetical protein
MLKNNLFNSVLFLFVGICIIYIFNNPPTVILKIPKIDDIKNISSNN